MTMAMIRPDLAAEGVLARNEYGCRRRARCSDTNTAWREGCRHPGAIAAHKQWLERKRAEREAIVAADGECRAATHGTRSAYEKSGCRCDAAVTAKMAHDARAKRAQRDREYQTEYVAEMERCKRKTGGRLDRDPRRPWRGGKMAVSEASVLLLTTGAHPGDATMAERLVALIRIEGKQVWATYGIEAKEAAGYRPLLQSEIAQRTGMSETVQRHLRRKRADLRELRTERRLADSKWRVAVAAEAAGRKERERERHMRSRDERQLRAVLREMAAIRAEQERRNLMPWLRHG